MLGKMVVVAALLLTGLSRVAAAADVPEHKNKNAEKVLALLKQLGVTHPDVKDLVNVADERVDDGYFRLAEEKMAGGTMRLHIQLRRDDYDMFHDLFRERSSGLKKLELRYTPDDSNFRAAARPDRFVVSYQLKF